MATTTVKVSAKHLKVGDVVLANFADPFYACQTVKQVTEDEVVFFRPYVQTSDFTTTGGVICYVGIEEYRVPRTGFQYELVRRGHAV